MSGSGRAAEGRGINYRALDDLFAIRDERRGEVRVACKAPVFFLPLLLLLLLLLLPCLLSPEHPLLVHTAHPPSALQNKPTTNTAQQQHNNNTTTTQQQQVDYKITVQMLEIYNETLRDLLTSERPTGTAARLDILSTQASGCNVPGAAQVEVESSADVAAIMARGAANRATSETKMNDRSSRSHQILTVIVDGYSHVTGGRSHGCLHLIDLAGSERVGKSEASGDRLVEAQHINKSLSALGDVMTALAAGSAHVPFRNSKLTQLLQDSLCGNAKVMMFMHISPEASMHGESVSTLNFAKRVAEVVLGQARRNVESGKVFRAAEAVAAARAAADQKDAALRSAQDALSAARREGGAAAAARDAAEREARDLRARLDVAQRELDRLLVFQQQQQQQQQQSVTVAVATAAVVPASSEAAAAALTPAGRFGVDRASARDQDAAFGLTPPSASGGGMRLSSGGGAGLGLTPPSRAPGSAAGGAKATSASKIPGVPPLATPRGARVGGGDVSLSTPREREGPYARGRVSLGGGGGGVSRQPSAGSLASERSSRRSSLSQAPMPMTARVGGVAAPMASASKLAVASARQSGTWGARGSSSSGGGGGGSGGGAAAANSGMATARATSRAVGRWK